MEAEVEEYLRRRYEDLIANIVRMSKEDLKMVCESMEACLLMIAKSSFGISTDVSSIAVSECSGSISCTTRYSSYCRCKSEENGCNGCLHRGRSVFPYFNHVDVDRLFNSMTISRRVPHLDPYSTLSSKSSMLENGMFHTTSALQ